MATEQIVGDKLQVTEVVERTKEDIDTELAAHIAQRDKELEDTTKKYEPVITKLTRQSKLFR